MHLITFLSDFNDQDWFVAAVKGEILKINPEAIIIDITHKIMPFDVRSAAIILKMVYKNFPPGTVHLAVVDPGVGGKRKPIIVLADNYYFVGPDNGLFSYIYNKRSMVYKIKVTEKVSATFHARDIFGPVSAKLSLGMPVEKLAARIKDYVKFEFPDIEIKRNRVYGEVIYIDHFGNLITSIPNHIRIGEFAIKSSITTQYRKLRIVDCYGEGRKDEPFAVKGSCGYYEIAVNTGSAQKVLKAKTGTKVSGKILGSA